MKLRSEFGGKLVPEVDEARCALCRICSASCPFEAIKLDTESGKIILAAENCKLCGICYSACPAAAISMPYFDLDSLVKYTEQARIEYDSATLVLMCRGSAPAFEEIREMFGVSKFIPLSLPCTGRTPIELFLKSLTMGIDRIYVIACDSDCCRFEKGNSIIRRKISLLQHLLHQFGYRKDIITLRQNRLRAKIDRYKCNGCLLCAHACPYDAISYHEQDEVAEVNELLCNGCGNCAAVCPSGTCSMEGSEDRHILNQIEAFL